MSDRLGGREFNGSVEVARLAIRELTGAQARECPWRSYDHPLVREVASLYQHGEQDALQQALIGEDPPRRLVEALACFDVAFRSVRAQLDQEEATERRQQHDKRMQQLSQRGGHR